MKALLSALVVLAMASPLCADMVLLSENFNGTVGNAVTTLPGWTGGGDVKLSSTVIDSGNSADFLSGTVGWGPSNVVTKSFTHTPGVGEIYTLTATLSAPGTSGQYVEVNLVNSVTGARADNQFGYSSLYMGVTGVVGGYASDAVHQIWGDVQPTVPVDIKYVLSDTLTQAYAKLHTDSAFSLVYSLATTPPALSGYNQVQVVGHGGYAGNADTILLTSNIPEPTTIILLATGLIGLLAYTWRKRR